MSNNITFRNWELLMGILENLRQSQRISKVEITFANEARPLESFGADSNMNVLYPGRTLTIEWNDHSNCKMSKLAYTDYHCECLHNSKS